eukprot:CAMPEP_0184548998 /NCGR_PEP_ID=MMETSP0199_2-20130426/6546_1 /TAXON_ID=1112570 /ORGANISM="Thraustochytrium sp., Strain LLF1b" /LENGTH=357 /DNA_ID=CAMNT_0026943679 /DNA_START=56 /DNA_END=1129 /DNA_ORIENTATION=-
MAADQGQISGESGIDHGALNDGPAIKASDDETKAASTPAHDGRVNEKDGDNEQTASAQDTQSAQVNAPGNEAGKKRPAPGDGSESATPTSKPKKPLSGYMIFMMEHRAQVAADNPNLKLGGVAQKVAEIWRDLSPEAKEKYTELAAKAKVEYKKAMELYIASGAAQEDKNGEATPEVGTVELPLARVTKIAKKNPDVKKLSKEAGLAVTKATELFVDYFAGVLADRAKFKNKRTINYGLVRECVLSGPEQLEFLEDDFPEQQRNESSTEDVDMEDGKESSKRAPVLDDAQHSLQSFFARKVRAPVPSPTDPDSPNEVAEDEDPEDAVTDKEQSSAGENENEKSIENVGQTAVVQTEA